MLNDPRQAEYSLDSFGSPPTVPPVRSSGRPTWLYILLGCGGGAGLVMMTCCACMLASVLISRNPTVMVTGWLTYMDSGYHGFAENFTCSGSQARDLTRELAAENVTFPQPQPPSANDRIVEVRTDMVRDGEVETWEATFTIIDGGPLGRCIDTIEVSE